jgi:hypothetical protein
VQRINSLADFISTRYGKTFHWRYWSHTLWSGLSVYRPAVESDFHQYEILSGTSSQPGLIGVLQDNTFYIALVLIVLSFSLNPLH